MPTEDLYNFIEKQIAVPKHHIPHYLRWIDHFLQFCNLTPGCFFAQDHIEIYLNHIEGQYKDWQMTQARQAVELYRVYLDIGYKKDTDRQIRYKDKWK